MLGSAISFVSALASFCLIIFFLRRMISLPSHAKNSVMTSVFGLIVVSRMAGLEHAFIGHFIGIVFTFNLIWNAVLQFRAYPRISKPRAAE